MKIELLAVGALVTSFVMAVPVVSDVTLTQRGSSKILISYRLSEPAVVTLDILTNVTGEAWASIGGVNVTNVWGDVNKVVCNATTEHQIWWRPSDEWKANFAHSYTVKAEVRAWALTAPPTYMVVDLMKEASKGDDPVCYFEDTSFFPYGKFSGKGTGIDPLYRGRYLVMRKIPAKGVTWRMGSPASELGKYPCENATSNGVEYNNSYDINVAQWQKETAHYVTLTSDYYLGVFEVTQEQCTRFIGVGILPENQADWPLPLGGGWAGALVNYEKFRGSVLRWPGNGHQVDARCAIDMLRKRSGIEFDLPTEAQWEFACRAGTLSALYTGKELSGVSGVNASLDPLAWYNENAGGTAHPVGEKEPNAFGLYDMLGNVGEFCLDRQVSNLGTADVVDPVGGESGDTQILKGGSYPKWAACSRAAFRQNFVKVTDEYNECGFRLWAPAVAK